MNWRKEFKYQALRRNCSVSPVLLFLLVCKLIRQQHVIGASGSDSLPPLARMLEGGTVGFIAGQKDFHQGSAVIMPADPSWLSLWEPCRKWAIGNKECSRRSRVLSPSVVLMQFVLTLVNVFLVISKLSTVEKWRDIPYWARIKVIAKHPTSELSVSLQTE